LTKPQKYGLALLVTALVCVGMVLFWPSGQHYISKSQQQSVLNFYKKNLHQGITRDQVQNFISEQRSQKQFPLQHPPPESISIGLGEIPGPWYCSREIVYLQFNFDAPTDTYRNVELTDELQDCL
jgi:hypothetical protein